MSIKKIAIGIGLLVVAVVAVRMIDSARYPRPIGGDDITHKRIAVSPDSQYAAFALTYEDKDFWGTTRRFYEFRITRLPSYTPVRVFKVVPPEGETVYDYSSSGQFQWASDSLGVEIGMFGAEMKIQALEQ